MRRMTRGWQRSPLRSAAYQFTRYRKGESRDIRLVLPEGVDGEDLSRIIEGVTLARDLINTPSNDMGPAELEDAARALAKKHDAKYRVVSGDALAKQFPLVHAVGAGSARAPRLIDFTWGKDSDPKITLVGKGVCFDTGGLDIKSDTGMLNMKKDMGGAATALALAHMIMARKLNVRLRVIIPAVENSISGTSFRPRDIYTSRKGISVEIGNTDAEGRLVLADALALADEENPALVVDFATLTGAARVALGPDVAAAFTDDDALAAELSGHAVAESDPLWRLPLWRPYDAMLDSKVADLNNVERRPGRRHHRRAVPAPVRNRKILDALRHLRLDACGQARPAGRRRMPGRARALCDAVREIFLIMVALDPRINPFRPEIAAKYLQGKVEARRFVEGTRYEVIEPVASVRRAASHEAQLVTEALMGERVTVYETTDEGWAWGQLETDNYVGWLSANALGAPGAAPTHKVTALRTLAFPGPDIKLPPAAALPMGAVVAIARQDERFAVTAQGWHIPAVHLAPLKAKQNGFRRGRRTISRCALSVGRQDLARHRLLGAGANFAASCRRQLSARQRHAGTGARQIVVARRSQARRSGVLERPRGHRPRRRNLTARQCASHGGGDRAGGGSHPPHQGGGRRSHQREAALGFTAPPRPRARFPDRRRRQTARACNRSSDS